MSQTGLQFLQNIRYYLFGDIETFLRVCAEAEQKEAERLSASKTDGGTRGWGAPAQIEIFKITVPITLSIFSVMDTTGFLLRNGSGASETEKNFRKFFEGEGMDETQLKFLVFFYRHAMVHSFFPNKEVAIASHSSLPNVLFYKDKDGIITLNANYLIKIFKLRFTAIVNDHNCHAKIETQFAKLQAEVSALLPDIDLEKFKGGLTSYP